MTVSLKTAEDIAGMRIAGKLAADVLEMIAEHVKPGVTTETLNIDVTVIKDRYFGDTSRMFHVGTVPVLSLIHI